jgi:hypothetical protein
MKQIRKINKILIGALMLVVIFSLDSCLKNSKYYTDFASVGASVDLPLAAANNNSPVAFAYDASITSVSIPFYINLASPKTLGTPVTATFALDTAFFNSYNDANGDTYSLMPDSVYTIINGWDRTIAPGHRLDSMYVKFDFTKMDLSQSYILPITIKSASVPIEQWNHLMINPSVKNKYDGNYNLQISTVGWGAYGIADGGSNNWGPISLVTSGGSSVIFNGAGTGGGQVAFAADGSGTYFGATEPQFTFDPVTNKLISVKNLAAPDSRNRAFQINPAVTDSRFDPDTHKVYLAYIMTQNTRPPQYIYDTLTYVGPR